MRIHLPCEGLERQKYPNRPALKTSPANDVQTSRPDATHRATSMGIARCVANVTRGRDRCDERVLARASQKGPRRTPRRDSDSRAAQALRSCAHNISNRLRIDQVWRMAVGGVHHEPVSAPDSLISGEVQGISPDSARVCPDSARIPERFRTSRLEFPAIRNRALLRIEQGIDLSIREFMSRSRGTRQTTPPLGFPGRSIPEMSNGDAQRESCLGARAAESWQDP